MSKNKLFTQSNSSHNQVRKNTFVTDPIVCLTLLLEQIRDLIVKEGGGHIVEIVGLDAEHADGTKLPEKKNKKKKEEPRLTPKGNDWFDILTHEKVSVA
jgi:hypothetical protein